MRHKRIVSAMQKAGAQVVHIHGGKYLATKGETSVEWRINGGMVEPGGDGDVGCIIKRHPETDSMHDLFMDDYSSTIKSAIVAINEPPYKRYNH